jgi:hypothetical protein
MSRQNFRGGDTLTRRQAALDIAQNAFDLSFGIHVSLR